MLCWRKVVKRERPAVGKRVIRAQKHVRSRSEQVAKAKPHSVGNVQKPRGVVFSQGKYSQVTEAIASIFKDLTRLRFIKDELKAVLALRLSHLHERICREREMLR